MAHARARAPGLSTLLESAGRPCPGEDTARDMHECRNARQLGALIGGLLPV
ncbi:hypothetical protein ACGFS9_18290 [Streptomyces sp. NPDC048566]|uniref:hypothetical protein n=1 Tax=Streptomyces sp. NPDC048566 TaxID=3365569 RepID=UPI003710A21A